ncbi:MAG: hypothetical protein E6Q97_12380 [Desulfurellales bacterium]|nr:MAG: hypothetical protein E6Q97_12380 [Desulfurellales bacterium]
MGDGNDKRYLAGCDGPRTRKSVLYYGWSGRGTRRFMRIYPNDSRDATLYRLRERHFPLLSMTGDRRGMR